MQNEIQELKRKRGLEGLSVEEMGHTGGRSPSMSAVTESAPRNSIQIQRQVGSSVEQLVHKSRRVTRTNLCRMKSLFSPGTQAKQVLTLLEAGFISISITAKDGLLHSLMSFTRTRSCYEFRVMSATCQTRIMQSFW